MPSTLPALMMGAGPWDIQVPAESETHAAKVHNAARPGAHGDRLLGFWKCRWSCIWVGCSVAIIDPYADMDFRGIGRRGQRGCSV